jgi:hypothetical protein
MAYRGPVLNELQLAPHRPAKHLPRRAPRSVGLFVCARSQRPTSLAVLNLPCQRLKQAASPALDIIFSHDLAAVTRRIDGICLRASGAVTGLFLTAGPHPGPVFLAPPCQPQAGLLLSALHRSTYPQAAPSFTGTIFAA